ncbi:hypothetical protein EVAR_76259_1 [Eumeta japonica]|uniref:Uncharacterized protein n=1 Tax=Eumeta variegata TaxID=151549 RepID=A0A4C1UQP4_EUMVA|nr:hypothetical protein EVAR_76259_1 [Eumeta japonica]
MAGKPFEFANELQLLGLTFKTHVAAKYRRMTDIYKQLACAAKVTWGVNPEIIKTIYVAVIELIVLYPAKPLEDANLEIVQKIVGSHVYNDDSKIEGKAGAALTWLEKGEEVINLTACSLLSSLGGPSVKWVIIPRTISVDVLLVSFATGERVDQLGYINESEVHEVVVYENRGTSNTKKRLFRTSLAGGAGGEQAENSQSKLLVKWTHPCISGSTSKSHKKLSRDKSLAGSSNTENTQRHVRGDVTINCQDKGEQLLTATLEDAKAVIYNNNSRTTLKRKMSTIHMAISDDGATNDLLILYEEQTHRCGKTTQVVKRFETRKDVVITTILKAARDLREKLAR